MIEEVILTIGHGNREVSVFLELLLSYAIEIVCDVRSVPYSARYKDYNRESLRRSLSDVGLKYLFLGELLGARPANPMLYSRGRASYVMMGQSNQFREGIERLRIGSKSYRIAVMCAEKEPLNCHRAILIAQHLRVSGLTVGHISADGQLETDPQLQRRLLNLYRLEQTSLFADNADDVVLREAYERRGAELAFEKRCGDDPEREM